MDSVMPRDTVQDAADHFGVSPRTIRNWIESGQLEAVRIGPKLLRVDINSLHTEAVGGAE